MLPHRPTHGCSSLVRCLWCGRPAYPPPAGASPILGLEVSGTIAARGPDCSLGLAEGEPVMALLPGGGYAEYVAVDERTVMPVPVGLSPLEAAAIPEAWLTAFQLLRAAGTGPGDRVLIHAGASGVGQAAVQLARLLGAVPLVTAGSQAKVDRAVAIGAEAGFVYKEAGWPDRVREHLKGVSVLGGG